MSNRAMAWAIECKGLPLATKAVLMLLADCHNGGTGLCFPDEDWLSERTGLSGRTVRMHLKVLEDAKLIERLYKHGGRGVGRQFDGYELKIDIKEAVKEPQNDTEIEQDVATAESCHGKNTSLPRQDTATPYKDKPEYNRKGICGKSALEEIWPHWSALGRKRGKSKAKLIDHLNRLSRAHDLEQVVSACIAYAKATDGQYHRALNGFLSGGQWENWIGQDMSPESPDQLSVEDWKPIARDYCDLDGLWPTKNGPAPHEPGCVMPDGLLRSIANRLGAQHRNYPGILQNLTREAA